MRAQKSGLIINIASDAAKVATPGESVIGAAMAAIVMFRQWKQSAMGFARML